MIAEMAIPKETSQRIEYLQKKGDPSMQAMPNRVSEVMSIFGRSNAPGLLIKKYYRKIIMAILCLPVLSLIVNSQIYGG